MAKKSKPTVKSISFADEYHAELEYFTQQKNSSEYVCELIRKDRLSSNDNIEDAIQKALQERLPEIMATMGMLQETKPPKKESKPKKEKPVPKANIEKEEVVLEDDIIDDFV